MEEEEDIFEVEEVLDHRLVRGKDFYYIHWKGFDQPEENTWEPIENLENCLDLVVAYYLKKEEEIPKNITALLDEFKTSDEESIGNIRDSPTESNEGHDDLERIQHIHKVEPEQKSDNSQNNNLQELVISKGSQNSSEPNVNNNSANEEKDDFDQPKKSWHDEIPDAPLSIEVRERKNISYHENDLSNYDSEILENSDISENNSMDVYSNEPIESEETSKSSSARSLWDIYGHSFKIKPSASTNKKDLIFKQDNVVELDVAQICGRRTLNGEIEYLVEFDGIADRYGWINKNDLNCDKEVRKFERKKKKNFSDKSFNFFCHKYDNKIPQPTPEEIARAHENVIRLRKELLGTSLDSKPEVPLKKKNMLKLLKIYEQNIE